MNIHLLEPERFPELPIEVDPTTSIVVVAEDPDSKEIKGYWVAQPQIHIEPIWLSPELRSGLTGIKMYAALLAALNQHGIKVFYTFIDKPEMAEYANRLGLILTPYITYMGIVPPIKEK